jgi:hypothetical protein
VFINEPEVRSDRAFRDELPIKIHSYHITFRVSFGYYVRDFHKDANLLIERTVEIIKRLHDWSNFGAVASCAFEAYQVVEGHPMSAASAPSKQSLDASGGPCFSTRMIRRTVL